MKRVYKNVKLWLALLLAMFSNGALPTIVAHAAPGNNGTVKINDEEVLSGQQNEPQLTSCNLNIKWFGFDEGTRTATVSFTGQGSTDTSQIVSPVGPQTETFTGTGAGGNTLAYSKDYTLSFTGTGPYHIKVTIVTDNANGSETKFKVFWLPASCQATVTAASITPHDVCGTENDYFIVPTTEHVGYALQIGNGATTPLTSGATVAATAWGVTYTVSATATDGYALTGPATQTFSFTDTLCVAQPSGSIGEVTCGEEGGTVTFSYANDADAETSAHFSIMVDGVEVTTATVAPGGSGSYDVTGLSDGEHTISLLESGKTIASSTFTVDCVDEPTPATPVAPMPYDMCYTNRDMLQIAETAGISYLVNGVDRSGDILYFNGTTITVTAVAQEGYVLTEGTASWTFTSTAFTNASCITVTKTGAAPVDTNGDGVISAGDIVTWTITVTNTTTEATADWFYVVVDDPGTTLENDGLVGKLNHGESKTLTATKALTDDDLRACSTTNTANFNVWYNYDNEEALFKKRMPSNLLESGSASARVSFTCPTPGQGHVDGETVTVPTTLPATGPTNTANPLLVLTAAAIAYGATFFLQGRRNLASTK